MSHPIKKKIQDTSARSRGDGSIRDTQEAMLYAKAVRDAVDRIRKESGGEHQIKKILVFTKRTVVSQLIQQDKYGVLPDFARFHMDSHLVSRERQQILSLFDECTCAIISNPALLKQGVDLPVLDMVVFGPGWSEVDITQKIGRSTRTSLRTGKSKGYVLLPLLGRNSTGPSSSSSSSPLPSHKLLSFYKEQNYAFVEDVAQKLGGALNAEVQFSIVEEETKEENEEPVIKNNSLFFKFLVI